MESPNILIIVIDALRADRVLHAGETVSTPEIDQFAAEATTFSNAFSTTNTTDPAVTSIQTGRYPLSHGILNHGKRVTNKEKQAVEQIKDLPMALSEAGYRTGKFGRPLGRWHRRGFDVYPESTAEGMSFDRSLSRTEKFHAWLTYIESNIGSSLDRIHPTARRKISDIYQQTKGALPGTSSQNERTSVTWESGTDQVVRNVEEFIQESEPFYAFVHLMDTHAPFSADVDQVVSRLRKNEYAVDRVSRAADKIPTYFTERIQAGEYPDIKEKYYFADGTPSSAVVNAHYDASVERADSRVGKLLRLFEENDLYDDTVTFVLSDHGESLTEHGIYYDHHGLYDVSTHVPLFVRSPDGKPSTVDEFVQVTDIAPTVESCVGSDRLDTDGVSLLPAVHGAEFTGHDYVMAEEAHTQRRRMIRSDESKLIYSLDGDTICRYCNVQHAPETELYDLSEDPGENTNTATENPEAVASLRESAEEAALQYERRCPTTSDSEELSYEDEDKIHEHLEALGYR